MPAGPTDRWDIRPPAFDRSPPPDRLVRWWHSGRPGDRRPARPRRRPGRGSSCPSAPTAGRRSAGRGRPGRESPASAVAARQSAGASRGFPVEAWPGSRRASSPGRRTMPPKRSPPPGPCEGEPASGRRAIAVGAGRKRFPTNPRAVAAASAREQPKRGANCAVGVSIPPRRPGGSVPYARFTRHGSSPANSICAAKAWGSAARARMSETA